MEVVGLGNAFRLTVQTIMELDVIHLMLLVFGLGVVGLLSFVAIWLYVKEGIRDGKH